MSATYAYTFLRDGDRCRTSVDRKNPSNECPILVYVNEGLSIHCTPEKARELGSMLLEAAAEAEALAKAGSQ